MKNVLIEFDEFLFKQNLSFEVTIIGGAALIIMEVIDRATKDVDCLYPIIPIEIQKASQEFAHKFKKYNLSQNWFNSGPKSLCRELPENWQNRTQTIFNGKALHLKTLGRSDLLLSKLFAFVDRQLDLNDCLALKPSVDELKQSINWLIKQDLNPLWPEHVKTSLNYLLKELGYEDEF